MNQRVVSLWVGVVLLGGCANTSMRPEDAFEPDVFVTADAGVDARVDDAPNVDAFAFDAAPDASRAPDAGTDAFSPDAFTPPPDICNNADDDSDGAVDEGGAVACSVAPHGERAACESGVCLCRATGTPPIVGSYADCNASWADGCETELGTNANCAACGDVCDAASDCHARDGTYACGPADILDFSIPEADGEIACIVRLDHQLVCRGLNSDFAISDSAPEDAVLGWTPVADGRGVTDVRTWRRAPVDGVAHLSICVATSENSVRCRGDNSTGLLKLPDLLPHRGWFQVRAPVTEVMSWSTWGGSGALVYESVTLTGGLWGGSTPLGRQRVLSAMSSYVRLDSELPVALFRFGELLTWGPPLPNLTPSGWRGDHDLFVVYVRPGWVTGVRDHACSRDVCCAAQGGGPDPGGSPLDVVCWGRTGRADGETTQVVGHPDVRLRWDLSRMIELAPRADGRIEGCIRIAAEGEPVRFFCADMTTAADTLGPVSPEPFHEEPSRVFGGATPQARVDWQAMCIQHRPDWWQCWGTHEGWGAP
jgi:hypothetical protein